MDVVSDVTIEDWRRQIDDIDDQLVELLNRRAACSMEIGQLKHQMNLDIAAPDREEQVIQRAIQHNQGVLDEQGIRRLFAAILEESRRLQARAGEQNSVEDEPHC
jgi:chorismate mutase